MVIRRPRLRWEDNIKIYFEEIGYEDLSEFISLRIGTSNGNSFNR
jgi:hypothetical protein